MAIGDAYKPAAATRPKREPEIIEGNTAKIYCTHCGDEITGVYVTKAGKHWHTVAPCRGEWASYSPPKPSEAVLIEPPPNGSSELEKPEAPIAMTGAPRGEIERAQAILSASEEVKEYKAKNQTTAETASGAALDALGAMLGVKRRTLGGYTGELESDQAYRARVLGEIDPHRARGLVSTEAKLDPMYGVRAVEPEPLRVYVAGASKEPIRCGAAMTMIKQGGHVITLDWLVAIELEGAANEGLDNEKRRRYAEADLEGVLSADLVWLLASTLPTTGSWTELGAALIARRFGLGPRVIVVSGPARERSIFAGLADFETNYDLEALNWIKIAAPNLVRSRP